MIAGKLRNSIARLNSSGSVDLGFNPDADGSVNVLALDADGRLLVAGLFTTIAGQTRNRLARFDSNGMLDPSFNPDVDGPVNSLVLQTDGAMFIGGVFSTVSGQPRLNLARIDANGDLDSDFNPGAPGVVCALALQVDGKLVVGGSFSMLGGQARDNFGRIGSAQATAQSLDLISYDNGSSVINWTRSGNAPELAQPPTLLFSLVGSTYAPVGMMQGNAGGWRYTGYVPPQTTPFFLRTSAPASSGLYGTSSSLTQNTRQFYVDSNDGIFHDGFQ